MKMNKVLKKCKQIKKKSAHVLAACLLTVVLFSPATVTASVWNECQLSVKLENATLRELFELIEEKFEYSFLVRNNDLDLNQRITLDVTDKPVEAILTEALKKQGATFSINENRVIVYKSNRKKASASNVAVAQTTQQTVKVSGTVVDAVTGEPVIGANVLVKGTTNGTITDYDGNFTFDAPANSILVVSYIGYLSMEVPVSNSPMQIKLREDTQALEEVVVVGYGVQKKESLTGALQTLNNEKLTNITTPSVQNMIAGKAPGVLVAPGNGRPGSEGRIIIRGKTSINGSTDPLYVIDGVIVGNKSEYASLNPADIESMSILKDAASTAVYGSQGANGVILITTKKARAGEKLNVNASVKIGFNKLSNGNVQMMNGAELYDYFKAFSNQESITFPRWKEDLRNADFDWWNLATQTGLAQDYNVSVSGGSEKLKSYLSLGYYNEEGAVKGYEYERYNFRMRSEYKPFSFLTIKPLISGNRRNIDNREYSITAMYKNLPWDSPYMEDGSLTPHRSSTWVDNSNTNYLLDLQWNYSESVTYSFMGNFDFDVKINDWLTFSSVNSFNFDQWQYHGYQDPRSSGGMGVNGRMEERIDTRTRRYTNQIFRLNKTFDKHVVTGLAAYEFNDFRFKNVSATGTGFISGFQILDVTSKPEKTSGLIQEDAMQSLILRGTYAYDNKYLFEASFRRDGASNFGDNAKYGNFFSMSGGWNIHREQFMEAYKWVDLLKLRASFGSTGNRPTSRYPQYDLYSVDEVYNRYNEKPGAFISQIGNKDLTWEKTYTLGVGLDIGLFGRIRAGFDFYDKSTDNILFSVPVSTYTGVTRIWQNIGSMNNTGFEMTLGVDIIKNKDWFWSVDMNLGTNRNEVEKLYGDIEQIVQTNIGGPAGSIARVIKPGHNLDTWYTREWAGVNPETGAPQWYKTNDKGERVLTGKYAEADQVILGTSTPDFFGGFSTTASWKKFDLNAVFTYSVGGKLYNYSRQEYDSDGTYTDRNQIKLRDNWKRWEKPGDIATHPRPAYNNKSKANNVSSRYIEDGDYLKLRSLTIGYNFKLPYVSHLRLFFSAENLFTLTPYSGVDPELPVKENDGAVTNVAGASVYPMTRKFMFGLNITL